MLFLERKKEVIIIFEVDIREGENSDAFNQRLIKSIVQ